MKCIELLPSFIAIYIQEIGVSIPNHVTNLNLLRFRILSRIYASQSSPYTWAKSYFHHI